MKNYFGFGLIANTNGSASGHQCLLTELNKWITTENNRAKLQNQVIFVKQSSPQITFFFLYPKYAFVDVIMLANKTVTTLES